MAHVKEDFVQYGLVFPSMDIQTVPGLAAEAEAADWDNCLPGYLAASDA